MPQMAPMNWFMMFFIFIITLIMFNLLNYFHYSSTNLSSKNFSSNQSKTMIWKW
nr:ATP synthase F0 subunit 8 [Stipomorpha sp.]